MPQFSRRWSNSKDRPIRPLLTLHWIAPLGWLSLCVQCADSTIFGICPFVTELIRNDLSDLLEKWKLFIFLGIFIWDDIISNVYELTLFECKRNYMRGNIHTILMGYLNIHQCKCRSATSNLHYHLRTRPSLVTETKSSSLEIYMSPVCTRTKYCSFHIIRIKVCIHIEREHFYIRRTCVIFHICAAVFIHETYITLPCRSCCAGMMWPEGIIWMSGDCWIT